MTISFVYGPGLPPAFSPDGTLVGYWAMDGAQALMFDAETGEAQTPLQAAGDRGSIGGFSPDGRSLVANAEGSVVVWDLEARDAASGPWPTKADMAGWSADGHFYVGQLEFENYEVSSVTIEALEDEGAVDATGPRNWSAPAEWHLARHPRPDVRYRLQLGDHQGYPLVPPTEQCRPGGCAAKKEPGK